MPPFSPTKQPTITQGKYGTIEDFGGGGMAYSDPRDNPKFKTPPTVETTPNIVKSGKKDTPPVNRTPAISALEKAQKEALITAESQKKARTEADTYAANMRQARIDAINTAFQPRINRQTDENAALMSRVNALNFNKGIVGSGVDTTKTGEQKNLNAKALEALEDEKAILIQEAFGKADALAKERYETLTKEAQDRAKSNVDYQKSLYDKSLEILDLFGASEATVDDIERADPNVLKTLREVGGLTDFQITALLNKKNPAMNAKVEFKDGVVYQYYTDPKTGKVKITAEKAEGVPENYSPSFAPDGTLVFLPDRFDPKKPYNEQVIVGSNFAKKSNNEFEYSVADKREDSKALEASRGSDGYVNSETYQSLYSAWLDAGGDLESFISEFPPKNYTNPDDESLPYYLKTKEERSI